ncbi:MAG: DUF177 domain-containing protein [Erysipelothrix sp.]|nr:DUF177 domain-containing protein [Erysipelothrix sp.]
MKWLLSDLAVDNNQKMFYQEEFQPDIKDFETIKRLKAIDSFNINGYWYYDDISDHLYTEFNLSGNIVIADSITLENIDYHIDVDSKEVFGFDQLDDVSDYLVKGDSIDLSPIINQIIVASIPFKFTSEETVYPKGESWEVITEADFNKEPKAVNPQMAKLLEIDIEGE